jgi:biopolymer transport protein ExbB
MNAVVEFFQAGGKLMYINLAVFFFGLAVIVERAVKLSQYGIREKEFMNAVETHLRSGNIEAAAQTAGKHRPRVMAHATFSLLVLMKNGYESPVIAVEEAMRDVKHLVNHRIGWLWTIANVGTLLGLVGTIFGLIGAFAMTASDKINAAEKAKILAGEIAHAMNNTAFGLAIAVVCIAAHGFLANFAHKFLEGTEHGLFHFVNIHAQYRKGYRPADSAAAKA